jgi:hypothetical protein
VRDWRSRRRRTYPNARRRGGVTAIFLYRSFTKEHACRIRIASNFPSQGISPNRPRPPAARPRIESPGGCLLRPGQATPGRKRVLKDRHVPARDRLASFLLNIRAQRA